MNRSSPLYRQWKGAPFELSIARERRTITVQDEAWVRSDLLVGLSAEVRNRFGPTQKGSRLDPESSGDEVIMLGIRHRAPGAGAAPPVPPSVAVIYRGPDPAVMSRDIAATALVPVRVDAALLGVDVQPPPEPLIIQWPTIGLEPWSGWMRGIQRVHDDRPPTTAPVLSDRRPVEPWRIAIILTTYNNPEWFIPCIEHVERAPSTDHDVELIIVDDGSEPEIRALLEARASERIRLAPARANLGYRASANEGAVLAFEGGADAVIFLNSDVLVTDGWIDRMVAAAQRCKADLVNPLCNDAGLISVPLCGQSSGGANRFAGGLSYHDIAAVLGFTVPSYPPAVTSVGNCMLVTRAAWTAHGPFHPAYGFGYGEECELWADVIAAGGRAVVADDAFVWHASHGTTGSAASEKERAGVDLFKRRRGAIYQAHIGEVARWNARTARARAAVASAQVDALPIQFFAVDIGPWGGAYVLLRLAAELAEFGPRVQVGHLQAKTLPEAFPLSLLRYPDERSVSDAFSQHSGWSAGIMVATHWSTGTIVERVRRLNPGVLPLAFWQDIESRFVGDGESETAPAAFDPYLRIADCIFNSRWTQAEGRRLFAASGTMIPVGIDTRLFRPQERRNAKIRILGMWRPQTPRRGHRLLASIYAGLRARFGSTVSLELFGWPEHAPPCDRHHGRLTQREVAALMRSVDIVIEPSEFQGFGLAGAEAMASGAALASADTGGVHTYAEHGRSALIVEHGALLDAVALLVEDGDLRRTLQAAGPPAIAPLAWPRIAALWGVHLAALWRERGSSQRFNRSAELLEERARRVLES